jgi:tetratricopeptide (TPR) repeat protein
LAWAAIARRDPLSARAALAQLPFDRLDYYLLAAYLSSCNRSEEALALLQEARAIGHRDRESTRLLIDLLLQRGSASDALEIARADHDLLSPDEWQAIEAAVPATRPA